MMMRCYGVFDDTNTGEDSDNSETTGDVAVRTGKVAVSRRYGTGGNSHGNYSLTFTALTTKVEGWFNLYI